MKVFNLLINILILFSFNSEYENAVYKYLCQKINGYNKIEIKLLNDWNRFESIKINDEKKLELKGNIAYVPVEYTTANRQNTLTQLAVEIKLFDEVLVANTNIKSGEELSADKFDLLIADVTNISRPVADYNCLLNKRATGFIKKDDVLSEHSIEEKPIIQPGDKLILHSSSGSVDVTLAVVSRQEGHLNEIIRVKTLDNKLLKARVIDKINVLVIE